MFQNAGLLSNTIMASIFKNTIIRYLDKNGRRVRKGTAGAKKKVIKTKKWYGSFTDDQGNRHRVVLYSDKAVSQRKLNELIDRKNKELAGVIDYSERFQALIDPLLNNFKDHLSIGQSGENTEDYVSTTVTRVSKLLSECKIVTLGELVNSLAKIRDLLSKKRIELASPNVEPLEGIANSYLEIAKAFGVAERTVTYWRQKGAPIKPRKPNNLAKIQKWHSEFKQQSGIGSGTYNHYVRALRTFGGFLVKTKYLQENPFRELNFLNAQIDVRRPRRTIPNNEFSRLIHSTASSKKRFRGLNGVDRSMLYLVAVGTGLRCRELASLRLNSLDFDSKVPVIVVEAGYSKRRQKDVQPMNKSLSEKLKCWSRDSIQQSRSPKTISIQEAKESTINDVLWSGSWSDNAAKMIRSDLKEAGIPYETEDGFFDFHSLRHQYITNLVNAGVHPRKAQQLARHSKIETTMKFYTHLSISDVAADLESLPETDPPSAEKATGTLGDVVDRMVEQTMSNSGHLSPSETKTKQVENIGLVDEKRKKPEEKLVSLGLSLSDADGTRTRNHWIDSPVL